MGKNKERLFAKQYNAVLKLTRPHHAYCLCTHRQYRHCFKIIGDLFICEGLRKRGAGGGGNVKLRCVEIFYIGIYYSIY